MHVRGVIVERKTEENQDWAAGLPLAKPHNIVFRTVELYIHRNCNLQVILRDPEAIRRDEKKSQAKWGRARAYNLAEIRLGPLVDSHWSRFWS